MKQRFLTRLLLSSLLYFSLTSAAEAQTTCDTCTQLTSLNAYAQDTSTNTATISSQLSELLKTVTLALFGTLPSLSNSMAAFTTIPAVQNNGYADQQALLHTVETSYQGSSNTGSTLSNNYKNIFGDYLLQESSSSPSFDVNNASIASLYVNPSAASFYSDDQRLAAQRFIILASGAAMSQMRKPSSDWLTVSSEHASSDRNKIRESVSAYYTYSAIESAIADNFSYVYGLNTGQVIEGSLDNYSGSTISESGLLTYIQSHKTENPDWYQEIGTMSVGGLLKEQTVLIGGCFLMLSRIEEDLRRILITNSTQASLTLISTEKLTELLSKIPKQ